MTLGANKGGRPVVFTPDMRRQIPIWFEEGQTIQQIAETIGSTPKSVEHFCYRNNLSIRKNGRMFLRLPDEIAQELKAQAATRKISSAELVSRLVNVVCKDDLFSAVLDNS